MQRENEALLAVDNNAVFPGERNLLDLGPAVASYDPFWTGRKA
jgi:hypothetical protein